MQEIGVSHECTQKIEEVNRLCAEIRNAIDSDDYHLATQLLARRHELLQSVFADPISAIDGPERLRALAEQVMEFDSELVPLADAARSRTAENLKTLRRSRKASDAYEQNSG